MRRAALADIVPFGVGHLALDRATLARAVDGAGLTRLALSLRRTAASPWLTVLTYHRVADVDEQGLLDEGVVDSSPAQFARQMAFVKRWFDVVTTDDVRAFVAGRAPLPRNPLLVTFDDGYRDNHDVALPILREHGVRATFFIATDYVERRRIYWWDRISLVVGQCTRDRIRLVYPRAEELALDGAAGKRRAIRRLQRIVKDEPLLDLPRFLDGLEEAAGVSVSSDDERRLADRLIMTWEHVVALHEAGMDVQSHTHTHRVLQTLAPDALDDELRTSRALLEAALGKTISAVSYPVGKSLRDAPHVVRAVREAGYELGFSNASGINRVRALDPFDAKRVSMDRSLTDSFFRAMLALPWLSY